MPFTGGCTRWCGNWIRVGALLVWLAAAWAHGAETHQAAARGDIATLRRLLVEKPALAKQADENGSQPLHLAARAGSLSAVIVLLDAGADPNAPDAAGMTALHLAAARGATEIAVLLAGRKANLSARDRQGWPPLFHAIAMNHQDTAEALLEQGAPVALRGNSGDTAMHWAASTGQVELMWRLLAKGASATTADNQGDTPLHWAVATGQVEAARVLLGEGASPTLADLEGQTPQTLARAQGTPALLALFPGAPAAIPAPPPAMAPAALPALPLPNPPNVPPAGFTSEPPLILARRLQAALAAGIPLPAPRWAARGGTLLWWGSGDVLCHYDTAAGALCAYLPWNDPGVTVYGAAADAGGVLLTTNRGLRRLDPAKPDPVLGYAGFIRLPLGAQASQPVTDADRALDAAVKAWQGTPYRWGGASRSGTDCSGFVLAAHQACGVALPHGSANLRVLPAGQTVRDELRFGDVLVIPGHAALYIGNGRTAETVRGAGVSYSTCWRRRSVIVRRFLNVPMSHPTLQLASRSGSAQSARQRAAAAKKKSTGKKK